MNSISFDFYEPSIPSPYAVPPGVSLEEASHALLAGEWPMMTSMASHSTRSPSTTFAQDGSFRPLSSLDDLSATHPKNLIEDINVANLGMNSSEVVLYSDHQTQTPTVFK